MSAEVGPAELPGSGAVYVLTDIVAACCLVSKMAANEEERWGVLGELREEQSLPEDSRGARGVPEVFLEPRMAVWESRAKKGRSQEKVRMVSGSKLCLTSQPRPLWLYV